MSAGFDVHARAVQAQTDAEVARLKSEVASLKSERETLRKALEDITHYGNDMTARIARAALTQG